MDIAALLSPSADATVSSSSSLVPPSQPQLHVLSNSNSASGPASSGSTANLHNNSHHHRLGSTSSQNLLPQQLAATTLSASDSRSPRPEEVPGQLHRYDPIASGRTVPPGGHYSAGPAPEHGRSSHHHMTAGMSTDQDVRMTGGRNSVSQSRSGSNPTASDGQAPMGHPPGQNKTPVSLLDSLSAGIRGMSPDLATLASLHLNAAAIPSPEYDDIKELISHLADHPDSYWAYLKLISLLHAIFVDRCRSYQTHPDSVRPVRPDNAQVDASPPSRSPKDINAIAILLEKARTGFSSIYTPSESMYIQWISDHISLACSLADRQLVLQKFQSAIELIPSSVKLWLLFTQTITRWWLLSTHSLDDLSLEILLADQYFSPLDIPPGRPHSPIPYSESDPARWPEHEIAETQHVFGWPTVSYFWTSALAATCPILSRESGALISCLSHVINKRLTQIELRIRDTKSLPPNEASVLDHDLRTERSSLIAHFRTLLENRLRSPHLTWDETSSIYSNIISQYYAPAAYESCMVDITQQAEPAKALMGDRVDFETQLSHPLDEPTAIAVWLEYIAWEKCNGRVVLRPPRRNAPERVLTAHVIDQARLDTEWRHRICALYDRLLSLYPIRDDLWVEWIDWLGSVERELTTDSPGPTPPKMPANVVAVLHRSSSFCPWSGSIWAFYIQTLESTGASFEECEDIKHKATSSGLLERSGLEELFKFYLAWCGFLHRRAALASAKSKDSDEGDEDVDVAEVGIRSALEHVRQVVGLVDASRLSKIQLPPRPGDEADHPRPSPGPAPIPVIHYTGDPQLRLERIFLKFAADRGNFVMVRECFDYLADYCGNSSEFWRQYYLFEMMAWASTTWTPANLARSHGASDTLSAIPRRATRVLYEAMKRLELLEDPHEFTVFLFNHCVQYESIDVVRNVTIDIRSAQKSLADRERAANGNGRPVSQEVQDGSRMVVDSVEDGYLNPAETTSAAATVRAPSVKRKLESDQHPEQPVGTMKKAKIADEFVSPAPNSVGTAEAGDRRDREHNSIFVHNLPASVSVGAVKRFFDGCGGIGSVQLIDSPGPADSKVALVEFDTHNDAVFALSRHVKQFDDSGRMLSLALAEDTTLWLTNYPSDADEEFLRSLVRPFGPVVQVRFPSLAKNPHRRFCYIAMFDRASAKAAETALDGKSLKDSTAGRDVMLVCKLSDPDRRQNRQGAMYEGREIIVRNWHYEGTDSELRHFVLEILKEDGVVGGDDGPDEKSAIERVRVPKSASGKGKGSGFVVFPTPELAQRAVEALTGHSFKGRALAVEITSPDHRHPKRTATIVASSDGFGANGTSDPNRDHDADLSGHSAKLRSMTLSNVPDTVSSAYIQKLVSPYGDIRKINLRPSSGTAVVEFLHEASVGKACLALDRMDLNSSTIEAKPGVAGGGGGSHPFSAGPNTSLGSGFVSRPRGGGQQRGRGRIRPAFARS